MGKKIDPTVELIDTRPGHNPNEFVPPTWAIKPTPKPYTVEDMPPMERKWHLTQPSTEYVDHFGMDHIGMRRLAASHVIQY